MTVSYLYSEREIAMAKWNNNVISVTQFTIDGKQPPADIQAEEYLLGCILSESKAIDRAGSITADVFYSEPNKAIFRACQRLQNKGDGINNISVSRELTSEERELFTEAPELYLYAITGKIGTTTDFENTAFHLQDVSAKREMVLSALKTITDIDKLDPLDSLTIVKERLKLIENVFYADYSFDKYIVPRCLDFDRPEAILFRDNDEILHRKDIQMIEGQSGSKKTFLVSAMIAGLIGYECEKSMYFNTNRTDVKVLFIDTEQSIGNVQRVARRIHRMAGFDEKIDKPNFNVLGLRECTPIERLAVVIKSIGKYKPDVVFIDNVKDLVNDFNNIEESTKAVTTLMQLASKNNCAICCVIHQNVGSAKARGHLGSMLYEKASLALTLKVVSEVTEVNYSKIRNVPPQPFAFMINQETILPELTEIVEPTTATNKLAGILEGIIESGKTISHTELTHRVMEKCNIKDSMAKKHITNALKAGLVHKNTVGQYYIMPKTEEQGKMNLGAEVRRDTEDDMPF